MTAEREWICYPDYIGWPTERCCTADEPHDHASSLCGYRHDQPPVPSGSEPVDPAQPDGAALIAAERQRQISAEGWTPDHDAEHTIGELVDAAVCYLRHGLDAESPVIWPWPWDESWWKPSDDSIRNLVRAGALVTAEIDRLQRAAAAREDHR